MNRSYPHAADAVEMLAGTIRAMQRAWTDLPNTAPLAQQLFSAMSNQLTGEPMRVKWDPDVISSVVRRYPRASTEVCLLTHAVAARLLWQRSRIAYTFDPTLWAELARTAPDDSLPAELFTFLPHIDPYIHFPEPLVLPVGAREQQRIIGVFVHGRATTADSARHRGGDPTIKYTGLGEGAIPEDFGERFAGMHCSTSDPECTGLSLSFAGLMETADGRPIDPQMPGLPQDILFTHTSLYMRDGATFGDLVRGAQERLGTEMTPGKARSEELPLMLRYAVGALVYLCCKNRDLRPVPAPPASRRKGKAGSARPRPAKVIGVGFKVGPQLRANRLRVEQMRHEGGADTGRTVMPHMRRAHTHMYRYGKGRTQRKLLWLHPMLINAGEPGERPTTVVPVP